MIDAKEIRVGNWIYQKCNKSYRQIEWYDIQHICERDKSAIHEVEARDLKPIPLSPELLIKCGFEGDEFIISDKGTCSKGLHFVSYTHDKTVYLAYDYDDCAYQSFNTEFNIEIKYLHQLQNLYWCLTQKELEVNL